MRKVRAFIGSTEKMIRMSVVCTLVGLVCVLLFLVCGFAPWSTGVGVFLGSPILVLGMTLYVFAVIGDLRRRRSL
jgi:hypothetical protein